MKTDTLFKRYFKILHEQDKGLESALPDATNPADVQPQDTETPPEVSAIGDTSGEQYIFRLALAALLTTPDMDDMGYVAEITKKLDSGSITINDAANLLKKRLMLSGGTSEVKSLLGTATTINKLPKTDSILNKL